MKSNYHLETVEIQNSYVICFKEGCHYEKDAATASK